MQVPHTPPAPHTPLALVDQIVAADVEIATTSNQADLVFYFCLHFLSKQVFLNQNANIFCFFFLSSE